MLNWKGLIAQGINFLYPPTCHSCDTKTKGELLCETCNSLIEPFILENCCPTCLSERECFCLLLKPQIHHCDSAFISQGPILDLNTNLLAKPLANLAYARFLQKNLPTPSSIICTQNKKFGKAFARKLNVPFNPKVPTAPLLVETHFDETHLFALAKKYPNASIFTLLSPNSLY